MVAHDAVYSASTPRTGTLRPNAGPTLSVTPSAKKTVLSDRFKIGEELGRGAYGTVYKGTDSKSEDTVAIKQISLGGMANGNLQSVMGEIELLKSLDHKNIVKYLGSFKSRTHLYIILEYMENGCLSNLIRQNNFGVFAEGIAAVYIAQVLAGLHYLHEQGVVHRDIKGANILTTKDGVVKLADFGVATKLGELEENRGELQQHVVGTPYWMAPEVIEMTQVTSASDIWSVGCLIVELLTGSPPYFDFQPMTALFRIVQDDHPPLPESISPLMEDFLMQCFRKDPNQRPTAKELLKHEWLLLNRRTLRKTWKKEDGTFGTAPGKANDAHETVHSVVSRILAAEDDLVPAKGVTTADSCLGDDEVTEVVSSSSSLHHVGAAAVGAAALGVAAGVAVSAGIGKHSEKGAVLPSMPPGGEAAAAGAESMRRQGGNKGDSASSAVPQQLQWMGLAEAGRVSLTSAAPRITSTSGLIPTQPSDQDSPLTDLMQGASMRDGTNIMALASWMDEGPPQQLGGSESRQWLRPSVQQSPAWGSTSATGGIFTPLVDGHSGLPSTSMQATALSPIGSTSLQPSTSARDFPPCGGAEAYVTVAGANREAAFSAENKIRVREFIRMLRPSIQNLNGGGSSSVLAASTAVEQLMRSGQAQEIKSLMLAEGAILVLLELLESENAINAEAALDLVACLTKNDVGLLERLCLVGLVPAACVYTAPKWSEPLRDKAAMFVQQLCFFRQSTLHMLIACQGLRQLVKMVGDGTMAPLQPMRLSAATSHAHGRLTYQGLQCIWRVLEAYSSLPLNYMCRMLAQAKIVPRLFLVLKEIPAVSPSATAPACSVSALPSTTTPLAAASSTHYASTLNFGMGASRSAVTPRSATAGFPSSPVSDKLGTPTSLGMVPPMTPATSMTAAQGHVNNGQAVGLSDKCSIPPPPVDMRTWLMDKVCSLLLVMAHADSVVKGFLCQPECLQQHLECLGKMQGPHLVKLMKCLRWLSSEVAVLPAIKDSGAINTLVPFLSKDRLALVGGVEVQLEALHALYNICNFNKKVHLEAASNAGIITHLCTIAMDAVGPLGVAPLQPPAERHARWGAQRVFVVPMLIGMVTTSASTRVKLWESRGVDVLLHLLTEQDNAVQVGVLQALDSWLAEDHNRLEQKLTHRESVAHLVELYARSCQQQEIQAMPQLLDTLRLMINRSSKLAVAVAVGGLVPWLLAMIEGAAPILRVKILEIIRCLYEHYPRPKEFIMLYKIQDVLRSLLMVHGSGSDKVHQVCQQLLSAFSINMLL